MAKGVGLDIGEFEVVVVELDGSYRKGRLRKISIERVATNGDPTVAAQKEADSALHALKDAHIGRENVAIAVPARDAVMRILTVPFKGIDNIRKVIKFESEGSIHSHSVDDMVVDFHVLEEGEKDTKVLVVAVPKTKLKTTLDALEAVGLEPEVADLDAMALLRVAEWCGALTGKLTAPPDVASELPAKTDDPAAARVVLDVGARSTRILVTVGGKLIDMRALRGGADAVAEEVAARSGGTLSSAREAVIHGLQTGEDYVLLAEEPTAEAIMLESDAEGDAADEAETGPAIKPPAPTISYQIVLKARDAFLERFRRELLRFVAAVPQLGRVESVWYTGGGARMPGVVETIEEVFHSPPRPLDVLGNLNHDLDQEQAQQLGPRMAVAVGLALRGMGGVPGFNFRSEQLAFTKKFDRVKFPLAIACMLLLFLTVVYLVKTYKQVQNLRMDYGQTAAAPAPDPKRRATKQKPLFLGYVGHFLNAGWFTDENHYPPDRYDKLLKDVEAAPVFQRLAVIKSALIRYHTELQEKSGVYSNMRLSSGLGALNAMAETIAKVESKLGRFLVTDIELKLLPHNEQRYLALKVALRGDDYTSKFIHLESAFREAAKSPDSPFLEIGKVLVKEAPWIDDGSGPGAFHELRVTLKPEGTYPVFRPPPVATPPPETKKK